jgi:serine/threonine protein kinase
MKRLLERKLSRSSAWETATSMPDELESAGVRRLVLLSTGIGLMCLLALPLRRLGSLRSFEGDLPGAAAAVDSGVLLLVSLCFGLAAAARFGRLSAPTIMRLGAALEVALVLIMAFLERVTFPFGSERIAVSVVVMPYLAFPVALPHPRRRRYLTTALALLALPLGNLVASVLVRPVTDWPFWFFSFSMSWMTALLGLGLWRIVFDMGRALRDAKELGAYRLGERIGEGGMGEVWTAEHRLLARPAAIKLVRPDRLGDGASNALSRFAREARATAELRSPHTVELFDFGQTADGAFYYVMELLDGVDLQQLVERYGPMSAARTVHILRQCCLSLAEAHGAGMVHRDIKPANVFLCSLGGQHDFVKVLDFGLVKPAVAGAAPDGIPRPPGIPAPEPPGARLASGSGSVPAVASMDSNLTIANSAMGTPAYMAPEQALGAPVDGRTDLYALGCVAYGLLTGRAVFEASSATAMMIEHVQREPLPPSRVSERSVPEALDSIVLSCLSKDPDERPASASALGHALASVAESHPWTEVDAATWWVLHQPSQARGAIAARRDALASETSERVGLTVTAAG